MEIELKMLYKFPGIYRGKALKNSGYITADDDEIVLELEDNWVTGDLYVFSWPGTEKNPSPFLAVYPDGEDKSTRLPISFEKFNSQTGEWEMFMHLDELIRLCEEGKIKLSHQWVKKTKQMRCFIRSRQAD